MEVDNTTEVVNETEFIGRPEYATCKLENNECESSQLQNVLPGQAVANASKTFSCRYCDRVFLKLPYLKRHMRIHSADKALKCPLCEKVFSNMTDFKRHTRTHTGEKPFACSDCGKAFVRSSYLKQHRFMKHTGTHNKEKTFMCSFCTQRFSYHYQLNVHMQSHIVSVPQIYEKNISVHCTTVSQSTINENDCIHETFDQTPCSSTTPLNPTMELSNESETCDRSGVYSASSSYLATRIQSGRKPYLCKQCGKRFLKSHDLKRHYFTHSGEKPFVCSICDKAFTRHSRLKSHMQQHAKKHPSVFQVSTVSDLSYNVAHVSDRIDKTHVCSHCEKSFLHKHGLDEHMLLHSSELGDHGNAFRNETSFDGSHTSEYASGTYKCYECSEIFSDLAELTRHCCESADVKPHCFELNETVSQHDTSDQITSSEPAKDVVCDICGKRFRYRSYLARHMLTHSGVKPHMCTFCDKSFLKSHDLKRHYLIHTGEKPFACMHCDKTFTRHNYLKSHLRLHDEPSHSEITSNLNDNSRDNGLEFERQVCSFCNEVFSELTDYAQHSCQQIGNSLSSHSHDELLDLHAKEKQVSDVLSRLSSNLEASIVPVDHDNHYLGETFDGSHTLEYVHETYKCNECGEVFSQLAERTRHSCELSEIKPQCFEFNETVFQHDTIDQIASTDNAKNVCGICDKGFKYPSYLVAHMRTHNGVKPYVCSFCDKSFRKSHDLKRHNLTHTGEKPFACMHCEKTFTRRNYLKSHLRSHGDASGITNVDESTSHLTENSRDNGLEFERHTCSLCSEVFSELTDFTQHCCQQVGEVPSKLSSCPDAYNDTPNQTLFEGTNKLEYGHGMYKCYECDEAFSQLAQFTHHNCERAEVKPQCSLSSEITVPHNITHQTTSSTDNAKNVCGICDKVFKYPSYLAAHMRIHNGVKQYVCSFCDKSFLKSHDLKRHNLTHTGEKPFACVHCEKTFTRPNYLKTHLWSHRV